MRICNRKKIFAFCVSFFVKICGFSQNLEPPQMPSMPQMPTISAEGSFYTPTFPSRARNQAKSQEKNAAAQNQNETVIKNQTINSSISALLGSNANSILTASDISALYDSGLFGNISSINNGNNGAFYGNDYALEKFSSDYNARASNSLLLQILAELEQLKNQQKNITAAEKEELSNAQTDSKNFRKREPSVLRFKINGYDLKNSLTETFFSDTEVDGTFLFTADRKYFADSKTCKETFYILFTAKNSKGVTVLYDVQPRIVQETKNENSYVYKFANKKNITAEKTGNLVTLHYSDDNLEADILLDIDKR